MDAETRKALHREAEAVLLRHAQLSKRTRENRCANLPAGLDRILAIQEKTSGPWWIETARGPVNMGYAPRWVIFDRALMVEAQRAVEQGYPVSISTTRAKSGETVYVTAIEARP
jgi:hypothetical protein